MGFRSLRAWEEEEPEDSFKLKVQLPSALTGPWEDYLEDLFVRSNMTWRDHIVGDPFCTGRNNEKGHGLIRVIWLHVDHVLLRQFVEVVEANDGDKSSFPALDARLMVKYPTYDGKGGEEKKADDENLE